MSIPNPLNADAMKDKKKAAKQTKKIKKLLKESHIHTISGFGTVEDAGLTLPKHQPSAYQRIMEWD